MTDETLVMPRPIFGETDARKAWITAEQELLETYVDEYEMCCGDGYYAPSEQERELIRNALQGFVVEHDELLAKHLALNPEAASRITSLEEEKRVLTLLVEESLYHLRLDARAKAYHEKALTALSAGGKSCDE